jgi:hypothetical protein
MKEEVYFVTDSVLELVDIPSKATVYLNSITCKRLIVKQKEEIMHFVGKHYDLQFQYGTLFD